MKNNYLIFILMLTFGIGFNTHVFGQVVYNGNGNDGFGGVLGLGDFSITDDGTEVTITFTKGTGNFDNALIIYIDSESGGFSDTSNFTDTGDELRKAISGFDGANRSTVNFPAGFEADHVIAAKPTLPSEFGGLWSLVNNGSHVFTASVDLIPNNSNTNPTYTMKFDFSEINSSAGANSFKFVATYLNQDNAFRSDEAIGDGIISGNPGQNSVTFNTYFEYSSGDEGGLASTAQAGDWSLPATWTNGNVPLAGDDVRINHNVTLNVSTAVPTIQIDNNSTLTVNASGSFTSSPDITIGSGSSLDIDNSITVGAVSEIGNGNGGTIDIAASQTLTINGADKGNLFQNSISGSGNLVMSGTGTTALNLYGTNSYTGTTIVNSGRISTSSAMSTSSLTITGGEFEANAANIIGDVPVVINGGIYDLNGNDEIGSLAGTGGEILLDAALSVGVDNTDTEYSGVISGNGSIVKAGTGTFTMSGTISYAGTLLANAGTIALNSNLNASSLILSGGNITTNAADRISDTAGVTVNSGTLTLGGDDTIGNLSGTGGFVVLSSHTLTTGDASDRSYSGVISGSGGLTKNGTGTFTISGANTYTGTTTINSGSIVLGAANVLANTSSLVLNGGTLSSGATTGFSETLGTLSVDSNSTIDLGTDSHTLTFADSSSETWAGGVLTINNWTGTAGSTTGGGTAGTIVVGIDNTSLISAQLEQIQFEGYPKGAVLTASGEVVPEFSALPTQNVSGISQLLQGSVSLEYSFSGGDGENTLIVMREASAVDFEPSNGTNYTANSDFSSGTGLGPSNDNKVIYNSNGSSFTVTGLSPGTTYFLRFYEYNGSGGTESYLLNNNNEQVTTSDEIWTVADGNYSNSATWETTTVPPAGSKVRIRHNVTLDQNAEVSEILIDSGDALVSEDGATRTLTISGGGTFTNNGTFTANDGTVSFSGTGTISGTTTFNNVDIAGGVNFGSASTIGGTLTINANGFAQTNSPIYGGNSTLTFSTGDTYTIGNGNTLWTQGSTVGTGVPFNVTVATSILTISEARDVTGTLTINSNASLSTTGGADLFIDGGLTNNGTFNQNGLVDVGGDFTNTSDYNNDSDSSGNGGSPGELLIVRGDFDNQLGATFDLSDQIGGDLEVKGNFTDNGGFTSNDRAVFFTGASAQTINATSTVTIDFIIIDTENGDNVIMNQNLNLPNNLTLTSGNLVLNGNTLTISGDIRPNNGPGTIIASGTDSTLEFTNTAARTIENADIQNNIVENLTFSGTGGVTINTDLSVTEAFSITAGDHELSSTYVLTPNPANFSIATGSSLTFKSDASGSAQLALNQLTNTAVDGEIVVERYMSGNRAFRFITSPTQFTTPTSINANWQEGATTATPNPADGFGTHITGEVGTIGNVNATSGLDETITGNESLFTYNSATNTYTPITNTLTTGLTAHTPYAIFIRGDRSIDLTNDLAAGTTTLRSKGDQLGASPLFTLSSTNSQISGVQDEYSLVPNPYQAIVDLCKVERQNLNDSFFVRSVNGSFGDWLEMDLSNTGLCAATPVPGAGTADSSLVPPGVAFFVRTTTTGSSLIQFSGNDITTDGNELTTVYNETPMFYINTRLYLTSELQNGDVERDAFGLRFDDQFTTLADNTEDIEKFINSNESIAVVNNGLKAIDKQAMPSIGDVVQLNTTGYSGSQYSLLFMMANAPSGLGVFIDDAYLGTQTELTDGFVYDFTIDASIPESIAEDRFSLVFDNTTLSTTDNVFGYNFSLYPNPAPNGRFYVTTPGLSGTAQVTLTNVLGQQVYAQQLDIQNQEVQIHADNLSSGVYMMNLSQGEQSFSTKVIIE